MAEYHISLTVYDGMTANVKTWNVDEARFALLSAALGDPQEDSTYAL